MTKTYPYALLEKQLSALVETSTDPIARAANVSAALFEALEQINWIGFYRVNNNTLLLGPFQGKPACVVLYPGKGVCAAAWEKKETLIVPDVHEFEGHIACDPLSCSELVTPVFNGKNIWGVLDADSPIPSRFGPDEKQLLEFAAGLIFS